MLHRDDRGEDGGGGAGLDDPRAALDPGEPERQDQHHRERRGRDQAQAAGDQHVAAEAGQPVLRELDPQAEEHHRDHRAAEEIGRATHDRGQREVQRVDRQRRDQAEDGGRLDDGDRGREPAAPYPVRRRDADRERAGGDRHEVDRRREDRVVAEREVDDGEAEVADIGEGDDQQVGGGDGRRAPEQPRDTEAERRAAELQRQHEADHSRGERPHYLGVAEESEDETGREDVIGEPREGARLQAEARADEVADEDEREDRPENVEEDRARCSHRPRCRSLRRRLYGGHYGTGGELWPSTGWTPDHPR